MLWSGESLERSSGTRGPSRYKTSRTDKPYTSARTYRDGRFPKLEMPRNIFAPYGPRLNALSRLERPPRALPRVFFYGLLHPKEGSRITLSLFKSFRSYRHSSLSTSSLNSSVVPYVNAATRLRFLVSLDRGFFRPRRIGLSERHSC